MSEFVKQSTNINFGVDKVDWFVDVNYSSSFTSKVELPFPSNTTNIIFIGKPFLFGQNCFERKLKNRTEMVGTKLRTVQWLAINSTTCTYFNTDRCLNKAPQSFQRICKLRGTPEIGLFAPRLRSRSIWSRLNFRGDRIHWAKQQMPSNKSGSTRVFMHFPQFCIIPKVLSKVLKDKVPMMVLVTLAWPSQLCYPEAIRCPCNNQCYWPGGEIS